MHRFKNILLLCDCDRSTLDRAATLAKDNRTRLTVVQVIKEPPSDRLQLDLGGVPLDLEKLAIKEYESRLKKFVAPLKQDGVRVSTKVLVGATHLEVVRDVIANKRGLVIMTAEGKGGLKERLFGSTSRHLMRQCPCPVWIMKPTRRKRFARILAAVDPDPSDKVRDSLNATILQLASSLAVQDSAELHVAHAWTLFGEHLLRRPGGLSEWEVRKFARQEAEQQRRSLDALLAQHTDGTARIHMIKGNADSVIPRIARTEKVDLLVMGTVCRTGIPGFFIGNTAETILGEVDCSVLTVKPEGFVSAVQLA
ncbi:MAG: universal stress protein [Pirellulaceae bacterium]